ncbi:MAG: 16S rRNA (adenine(1518)-N(6)/adenine(1519)-N(6))-dimethyltransferase RsmA [Treponema sp.]|nr:16S rRNA (adenine(1518)-N(6)/adenine(1519)-N(6))-dimethyltransferase RsmA [Treponema sp.]
MKHPDYNSAAALKTCLDEHGFSMQKKFGQNFLINPDARTKIVDALDLQKDTTIWEVGPGLGAMTNEILEKGANLTAFEIDKGFAGLVNQFFEDYKKTDHFRVVEGDVLKTWKKQLKEAGQPQRFFGNLPYNIAATLVADTIEEGIRFERCVFTVQKEVALRMAAKPDTDDYSSFSVICQWAYDIKVIGDLSGSNFWPKPNVDSRSVIFTPKENFPNCENPQLFMKMQRALFSSRRKTVRNNLSGFLSDKDLTVACLEKAGIDPMKRAEALSIEQMLKLSDVINQAER